jgi:hypothetical protein
MCLVEHVCWADHDSRLDSEAAKKAMLPGTTKMGRPTPEETHEAASSTTIMVVSNLGFEWDDERLRSSFAGHSPVLARANKTVASSLLRLAGAA